MGCFSAQWLESLFIWIVIIGAAVAILKVLANFVLPRLGIDLTVIVQIINILVWALVAIAIIIFAFTMIGCLTGYLPSLPRHG